MARKVIGFRIEPEYEELLRRIAEREGIHLSDLVKRIVVDYLKAYTPPAEGSGDDETIRKLNEIVELAKKKMEEVYKKWINHIDTVVKEIVERHPNEDPIQWRNDYYKRYKYSIYSDLKIIVERYSNEIKTMPISDQLKHQYYKKLWDILNSYHLYP